MTCRQSKSNNQNISYSMSSEWWHVLNVLLGNSGAFLYLASNSAKFSTISWLSLVYSIEELWSTQIGGITSTFFRKSFCLLSTDVIYSKRQILVDSWASPRSTWEIFQHFLILLKSVIYVLLAGSILKHFKVLY